MEDTEKEGGQRPARRPSVYRTGKYRWAVYPDYWKESWGKPPLLGFVIADDEFYAVREAYTRNLLQVNFTFGPRVVNVGVVKPR